MPEFENEGDSYGNNNLEADEQYTEGAEEEAETEGSPAESTIVPYTTEEIVALLADEDSTIDSKRLTPEMALLRRELQKPITRKSQELSEKLKTLDDWRREREESKAKTPPQTIEEAYDRDPEGVTRWIKSEISRLVNEDAYTNAAQIENLRNQQTDLIRREVKQTREREAQQAKAAAYRDDIVSVLNSAKVDGNTLAKFAIEELGYSAEELEYETNPMQTGAKAVKAVERIARLYSKLNPKATAETKAVRPTPTKGQPPGSGMAPKQNVDLSKLLEKANETGDYSAYYRAKGL